MAHNYYYFIASLPYINYGDKPPVSSEEFREQCRNFLTKSDAALLRYCYYDSKLAMETEKSTGSAFIDLLMHRQRILGLTLAKLRAARLKVPGPEEEASQDIPRVIAAAKAAFDMDDPLAAELSLDRARWSVLDEMVGTNYFGVNNIYAYLMKLQLLERKQSFNEALGFTEYRNIYDTILHDYNSRS
ncbi:MAG: DUF2764 domain-containing protein [Treponema sp.]|nr:DUF2764 domain-containing protein [Treponema sp.]